MSRYQGASEAEVVEACRSGARWAQRALFDAHHRALFRFLLTRCGDRSLAEDVVQETFVAAFESIASFREESRLETWLTSIALNRLNAIFRRRAIRRDRLAEVTSGDPRRAWVNGLAGGRADIALRDLVARALERLDEADTTIILLHDLQGFRYREIAQLLDIAVGTVGSRLSRARTRLRAIVREIAPDREETDRPVHRTIAKERADASPAPERRSREPRPRGSHR